MDRVRRTLWPAIFAWITLQPVLRIVTEAADPSQMVQGLPGQPTVNFNQYAGEVTVNKEHGRALFYWFFEADHPDSSSLPLAVWFNGGPGCSSVGNGALSELGPFYTNDNATGLVLNKYSWTKVANILFLESPFGVGFSYSNTSTDYDHFSDNGAAEDVLAFLLAWFQKFPEYNPNDFYLIGESYAGHYIPTLALEVLRNNEIEGALKINFKGFAIGNPWTDAYYDNSGTTHFFHSHSLISDETYNGLIENCDFANDLPVDSDSDNSTCNQALNQANTDMQDINLYNIYAPSCNSPSSGRPTKTFYLAAAYNPCSDSVTPYLNSPEVQASLHVSTPRNWSGCSPIVFQNYLRKDVVGSMLSVYQELLKKNLKIWIYSGDVDGVVATTATRSWIKQLNLTTEVGGWSQVYSGLTFTTVRGAGHMVPATRPAQALEIFKRFLAGSHLPSF
ncbi:hypothetical protein O6H91_Y542900 [Diphasiastrum complanatum]|nr:hypothetical protein O6H91_Y542900 [Diphasiastrum complanatum]